MGIIIIIYNGDKEVVNYTSEVIDIAAKLMREIVSLLSLKRGSGKNLVNYRPLAQWFLKDIKCKEEEFILALRYLREKEPNIYNRIDIPPRWDGKAHVEYPELFIDGNEVRVKAINYVPRMLVDEDIGRIGPFEKGEEFTVPKEVAVPLIQRRFVDLIENA